MDVDWFETQGIAEEEDAFPSLLNLADREEGRRTREEIVSTIDMIGGSIRSYRREGSKQARVIVSEIHSGPRVAERARRRRKYGIQAGVALD